MPELPEIEHLRRTLEQVLPGTMVRGVTLLRPDIVRCSDSRSRRPRPRVSRRDLLIGQQIHRLVRHGKELAIVSRAGPVICVHLGMSGQLWHCPPGKRLRRTDHVHCLWQLTAPRTGRAHGRLVFRDPRRFGGLWCFTSLQELFAMRWKQLGPDALQIGTARLRQSLAGTSRSIKAALLDQRILAGIGNIYADEILFAAGIHPQSAASRLPADRYRRLALTIRHLLATAIAHGGSTVRDYIDGHGSAGSYAQCHRVYGRAAMPCTTCGQRLCALIVAQRTTVFCSVCQALFRRES